MVTHDIHLPAAFDEAMRRLRSVQVSEAQIDEILDLLPVVDAVRSRLREREHSRPSRDRDLDWLVQTFGDGLRVRDGIELNGDLE
jgi:hypothetical protein